MDEIIDVLVRHGYLVVFAWVLAEQIGLPLPAVPFLLAAGALAGNGRLSLALILAAAALASLMSDSLWYWIGRVRGGRVLHWLCRVFLEPDSCVRRTQDAFGRYGARSLPFAKFVPGFNTAAPPLAGIIRMPLPEFLVFTGLGGVIWSGTFVGAGWLFSSSSRRPRGTPRAWGAGSSCCWPSRSAPTSPGSSSRASASCGGSGLLGLRRRSSRPGSTRAKT